jgi:hypothetical protein
MPPALRMAGSPLLERTGVDKFIVIGVPPCDKDVSEQQLEEEEEEEEAEVLVDAEVVVSVDPEE